MKKNFYKYLANVFTYTGYILAMPFILIATFFTEKLHHVEVIEGLGKLEDIIISFGGFDETP